MTWPVSPDKFVAFLAVMTAMSVMPGPAMLFAVAAGMQHGRRGVVLATLGMNTAALVWFVASALGLVIVATTLPWLFTAAGGIGVLYIAWLGADALRGAFRREAPPPRALRTVGASVLRDGFVVQFTNPKALLFFTAVLPPFVEINRAIWPQMAAFALVAVSIDGVFMVVYGILGAAFSHKMQEPRFRRGFSVFVGTFLLVVALLMALRL